MNRHEIRGLAFYTFESLAAHPEVIHGVTTRHGGVSTGHWTSLNLTKGNGDRPAAVDENLHRTAAALDVPFEDLVSPNQQHTALTQQVRAADRGKILQGVDALHTNETGVPILLRFADCTPILLYDPGHHAFAVVHSGWRGTVGGIVRRAVDAMAAAYDTRPNQIIACIGPCIGPCCYEVGDEVTDAVRQSFAEPDGLLPRHGARDHFDLWAANLRWLRDAGVQQIEVAGICTACHHDEFYSYRAGKGRTGHFGALMMLRE